MEIRGVKNGELEAERAPCDDEAEERQDGA
jgi:hypothetical protein